MSLIGSLEDLGLGDILQIISLSQKSGVLSIRGEDGEGEIVLKDGLVRGACLKGGPVDLRGVLVGGRFLEPEQFDEALERARSEGVTVEEAIAAHTELTAERIDSLRRECVEAAVMSMFAWQTGEFSFDVRSDSEGGEVPLFLPQGINAQYLAMEGSRIEDESSHIRSAFHDEAGEEMPDEPPEMSAEEMFGVDPAEALSVGPGIGDPASAAESDPNEDTLHDVSPAAVEALGLAVAGRVDAEPESLPTEELAPGDEEDSDEGFAFAEPIEPEVAAAPEVVPEEVPVTAAPVEAEVALRAEEPTVVPEVAPAAPAVSEAAPVAPVPPAEPVVEPAPVAASAPAREVPVPEAPAAVESAPLQPVAASAPDAPRAEGAVQALPTAPLVVIDPDLVALEWIKHTLKDAFPRIHIFQRWDLGLSPIRQYLARATRPVVLVAPRSAGDPLSGIRSSHDFVARLKAQQPRLPILWLCQPEDDPIVQAAPADGVLVRPGSQHLRSPRAVGQMAEMAALLRGELATVLTREKPVTETRGPAPRRASGSGSLSRLKEATRALADASTRGEVLPLVIRFAAEVFGRVAMFVVRGDSVMGIAQSGLPAAGGPENESLRQVEVSGKASAWFRNVLETGRPVRSGPTDGGDYTLSALLGNSAPSEAYVAPIESGGQIVALLYGDNLPDRLPLGDTEALEVVLQHAGLALERAVLERALAEAEQAPAD